MRKLNSGGGWQAIRYTLGSARKVGPLKFWAAMRSKNACKTCALGMGGQLGGMTNEEGHFPEAGKKSVQAMAADMQGRIEPRFFATYSREELKSFSSRELEACGRLADPVVAGPGDTHYKPISWDDALNLIAGSLKGTKPERSFFYASGRSSNEAGFILQLLARVYGTNHVTNCSYYCHQASGAGLSDSLGTSTATVVLEDLDKCDLVFLIGGNPASNHPRLMTKLMKLRQRGGRVIVVNPLREVGLENFRVPSSARSMLFGTEIASTYVQPTIGGDIALMAGIAKRLIELGAVDKEFVKSATQDYERVRAHVEGLSWSEIERGCGVPREEIEGIAAEYARSERTVFSWTMGITHHEHGVQNVHWIVNLALLRGMVGKPGAGLLPIRGHSNVQGMGSIGVTSAIKTAVLERLTALGVQAPPFAGYDTMACLEAAERGEMDFGLCLGGNLYGASPDAEFVARSLESLDTLVYMSTTLNTGHVHGLGKTTLILPVLARDEESQSTTQESMFNYVRLSDGGPSRVDGPRSEVDILSEIAHRSLGEGGPIEWDVLKDHDEIRKLIARLVPGFEELETIGKTKKEFQIPGRVLRRAEFNTPSGKAKFVADPIPELQALGVDQVRLMTLRSEGQFNTVVYEEEDIYRVQERRDVILMNGRDIERLKLSVDQRVDVYNEVGRMRNVLVRTFDIAPGCAAMYYPEANVLVSRKTDPRSKTPAFKSVIVTVEPSNGSVSDGDPNSELENKSAPDRRNSSRGNMKSC